MKEEIDRKEIKIGDVVLIGYDFTKTTNKVLITNIHNSNGFINLKGVWFEGDTIGKDYFISKNNIVKKIIERDVDISKYTKAIYIPNEGKYDYLDEYFNGV